jgi:hypothetical protein
LWGAKMAFWCRMEIYWWQEHFLLFPKCVKLLTERQILHKSNDNERDHLFHSMDKISFSSNIFWIRKKLPGITARQNSHKYLHEAGLIYCVCNMAIPSTFLWN